MEIVLVMLNTFQEYILDAIQCLRKFNNHKIVVLTDCVMINIFQERNIKVVAVEGKHIPKYRDSHSPLKDSSVNFITDAKQFKLEGLKIANSRDDITNKIAWGGNGSINLSEKLIKMLLSST